MESRRLVRVAHDGVPGGGQVVGNDGSVEEVPTHGVDALDGPGQGQVDSTGQIVDRAPELVRVAGIGQDP